MTPPIDGDRSPIDQSEVTAFLGQIVADRAAIEQVKGILMLVYRIDDNDAFKLLRSRSQHANIKLRTLAKALLPELVTTPYRDEMSLRRRVDLLVDAVCAQARDDST